MSKYDKASLVHIPSGYKSGTLYNVLPNDADGDFDFTRASTATRVDENGLIETIATGTPRLNYPLLDGVVQDNPALLLEPQSTNLFTYSEALSNWTNIQYATVTDNDIVSPDGSQNASRINETTDNTVHRIFLNPSVLSAKHSFSVFLKKGTRKWAYLRLDGALTGQRTWFDLENGVLGTVNSDHIATIEDFGNGWYRCSVSIAGTTYDTTPLGIIAITKGNNVQDYVGDVNEYIYAWGAQLEQGSYPTSYIPTSGSSVTRSADAANGAGTANDFNDSEGVLYANIAALANDGNYKAITIGDGTINNHVLLALGNTNNLITWEIQSGGSSSVFTSYSANVLEFNKIAVKYKTNDFALWLNGIEVMVDANGNSPTGLDVLDFRRTDGNLPFYGNTKEVIVFNEALSDTELEALTSYDSFNSMATEQLYTIE